MEAMCKVFCIKAGMGVWSLFIMSVLVPGLCLQFLFYYPSTTHFLAVIYNFYVVDIFLTQYNKKVIL